MSSAEIIAKAAKESFDAAQLISDGSGERIKALRLVREALLAGKQEILQANAKDLEVGANVHS